MIDIDDDGRFKIVTAQRFRRPLAAAKHGRAHLANLVEFLFNFLTLCR